MSAQHLKNLKKYFKKRFIDSLRLFTKGGAGGNGLPKFGGIGGQGGNVYAMACDSVPDLLAVLKSNRSKRLIGGTGGDSETKCLLGEAGESAIVKVPVGISIYRDDNKHLADLNRPGQKALLARGGVGGSQHSGYLGLKGQAHTVRLDYKMVADIGFVGFPNAGKSTLLAAVSKCKPKIANYPFTTIRPNVGKIEYEDLRQITVADLPGLIEGAHLNVGMGHKFLKHIERTMLILMVVDVAGFQLSAKYARRSCLETVLLLNREIELYNENFLKKPAMLVVNKLDVAGSQKQYDELLDQLSHLPEILDDFPEDWRPQTLIQFDHIQPLVARDPHHETIAKFKEAARHYLDLYSDLETNAHEQEAAIVEKLRNSIQEKAPQLS